MQKNTLLHSRKPTTLSSARRSVPILRRPVSAKATEATVVTGWRRLCATVMGFSWRTGEKQRLKTLKIKPEIQAEMPFCWFFSICSLELCKQVITNRFGHLDLHRIELFLFINVGRPQSGQNIRDEFHWWYEPLFAAVAWCWNSDIQ